MSKKPQDTVIGTSPLGGNGAEGTVSGFAEVRDTSVQKVPLLWDDRAQAYISEQAIEELDDRDISLAKAQVFDQEEAFKAKAGYKRSL